jgi:stress response protein YsnF
MATQHQHERRMVAGLFHNAPDAERAVRALQVALFDKDAIGLAARDPAQRELLDQRTGLEVEESGAKAAEGGARGILETIASWFNPDSSGRLTNVLTDQGFSPNAAQRIEDGFQAGMILVTVRAGDRADEALAILRSAAAELGEPAPTGTTAGTTGTTGTTGMAEATRRDLADLTEAQRLELRAEELEVQKRQREAGEVRVRKEVIVQKRPVVREEVSRGKREVVGTERVAETVRHEELRVESEGDVNMRTTGTPGQRPAYTGPERRRRRDVSYSGPERRVAAAP